MAVPAFGHPLIVIGKLEEGSIYIVSLSERIKAWPSTSLVFGNSSQKARPPNSCSVLGMMVLYNTDASSQPTAATSGADQQHLCVTHRRTLPPCGGRIMSSWIRHISPVKPTTGLSHIISLYVIAMVSCNYYGGRSQRARYHIITFQHQVSRTFNHRWCAVIHNNHLHTLSRITTVMVAVHVRVMVDSCGQLPGKVASV